MIKKLKNIKKNQCCSNYRKKTISLNLSLFLTLFCIVFQEQAKLIFFRSFSTLPDHETFNFWWAIGQCVGFPLMGIFSDIRTRRKILALAVFFLTCSLIFLQLGWIKAAILSYSFGAVSTVARATFCEIHVERIEHEFNEKRTPNIIYTFLAEPWAWIFFAFLSFSSTKFFHGFSYCSAVQGLFIIYFVWNYLKDSRGNPIHKLSLKEILKELAKGKKKIVMLRGAAAVFIVIVTFFVGESLWTVAEYYTGSGNKLIVIGKNLEFSLGVYYLLGILVALFLKKWVSRYAEVFLGLVFFGISLVVLFSYLYWNASGSDYDVIKSMFPFVTLIGGIGLPLIYVFFGGSKKIGTHLLGMIYGAIEALQNLTDIFGAYLEKRFDVSANETSFVLILFFAFFISSLLYLCISIYKSKNNKFLKEEL